MKIEDVIQASEDAINAVKARNLSHAGAAVALAMALGRLASSAKLTVSRLQQIIAISQKPDSLIRIGELLGYAPITTPRKQDLS